MCRACLNAVHESGAVFFVQQVPAHLNDVVGPDAQKVAVEGGVVELAQGQTVRYDRFSGLGVGHDVRRVEQFGMAESAERALVPVGSQHPLAKRPLVESLPHRSGSVPAPRPLRVVMDGGPRGPRGRPTMTLLVDRHCEGQSFPVVANDEHGPGGDVSAGHQAVQVDQRQPLLPREPQATVVRVLRVFTTVAIAQKTVGPEGIVVRTVGRRPDRERRIAQHPWLEDALG